MASGHDIPGVVGGQRHIDGPAKPRYMRARHMPSNNDLTRLLKNAMPISRKLKSAATPKRASSPPPAAARSRYHVEAIQRGLDVLVLFDAERSQLSLAEISRLTDSASSTTLRIVNTLEDMGFLEGLPTQGLYRPGASCLRLGHAMIAGSRLHGMVRPLLGRIGRQTGEAAGLTVFDDGTMHVIDYIAPSNPLAIPLRVGSRLSAVHTAEGRSVLAFSAPETVDSVLAGAVSAAPGGVETTMAALSEIRAAGYAVQDGSPIAGIRSIAAPILDENGQGIAAVSVAVAVGRYDRGEVEREIVPAVVGAAAEVSARWRADRAAAVPAPDPDVPAASELDQPDQRSRYHVEALARGLQMLLAFTPATPRMALTEIAHRTDMLISTAFRVAATLVGLGYLKLDRLTNAYELAPKSLTLGYDSLAALDMKELFLPALARLHARSAASLFLSVPVGQETIDVLSFTQPGRGTTVGRSFPLYCTPGGKIFLAFTEPAQAEMVLDRIELVPRAPKTLTDRGRLEAELVAIRAEGYSLVEEEYLPGIGGIGVPIFAENQRYVAGLAMSVPASRLSSEDERLHLIATMREAGQDLSLRLAWLFN